MIYKNIVKKPKEMSKKVKKLPFSEFSEKFIRDYNYTLHEEIPEYKLLIYKNRKNILAINKDGSFFQVSSIRNRKNFLRTITELKEKFQENLECEKILVDSDEQKKIALEDKFNFLLEKKRQNKIVY